MSCAEISRQIPLYCYGEVGSEAEERIESHLTECPACRDELARYRLFLELLDTREDALEVAALARWQVERRMELDLGLAAGEVPEVLGGAQRAIDARRADLEAERLRDRIFDVEHRGQLARQVLAVLEIDAVLGHGADVGGAVEREVDRDAQRPSALLEQEAQIDQLVAGRLADGLDDRDQALLEGAGRGHEIDEKCGFSRKKRWPGGHLYRRAIEAAGMGTIGWITEQEVSDKLPTGDLAIVTVR